MRYPGKFSSGVVADPEHGKVLRSTLEKQATVHELMPWYNILTPKKPIVLPGTPQQSPLAGITIDQVIELLIAKLTVVANAREASTALPATSATTGFHVPVVAPPRVVARPANTARPSIIKRRSTPTRKP